MQLPYPSAHPFPLILAPMAGVSEAPFRQICRRMGADVVLSEFLSSEAIRRRIRTTLEGAEFEEVERPIGIQIYGADPNAMAEAAALITEHYRPEFIDINFGCPVKKVVQRNGGSGCLRDLDLVDRIIRAVIGATHLPVTVKTRSGWSDEQRDPVEHRAADAGRGRPRLHAARAHPDADVLGQGQLGRDRARGRGARHPGHRQRRRPDRRGHRAHARPHRLRGHHGRPRRVRQSVAVPRRRRRCSRAEPLPAAPAAAERFQVALEHARLALRLQGDTRKTVIEFRKHLGWYTRGLHGASELRQRLFQIESIAEAEAIFLEYLEPVAAVA